MGERESGGNGRPRAARIVDHRQLRVYQLARRCAMHLFELSRDFPREELYALTSQARRSSRSVCANIAEGWQKRRYPASFTSKMVDAAAEADETRCWLDLAAECDLLEGESADALAREYDTIIAMLVRMANAPHQWRTH